MTVLYCLLSCHVGFGWDRVDSLFSSQYEALIWVFSEGSVDNTGMSWLLLSSAYSESRPFLLFAPPDQ